MSRKRFLKGILAAGILGVTLTLSGCGKDKSQEVKERETKIESQNNVKEETEEESKTEVETGKLTKDQMETYGEGWNKELKYINQNGNIAIAREVFSELDSEQIEKIEALEVTTEELLENMEEYYGDFIEISGVPQYGDIYDKGSETANKISGGEACGRVVVKLDEKTYMSYLYIGNISRYLKDEKISFKGLVVGLGKSNDTEEGEEDVKQIVIVGK